MNKCSDSTCDSSSKFYCLNTLVQRKNDIKNWKWEHQLQLHGHDSNDYHMDEQGVYWPSPKPEVSNVQSIQEPKPKPNLPKRERKYTGAIPIRFKPEVYAKAKELANKKGIQCGKMFRDIIEKYLENEPW